MTTAKILVLSGSIRSESFNTKLAGAVTRELALMNCDVTRISLTDYPLSLYNGDLEADEGIPKNACMLAELLDRHDGYFIVSPEYNGSLTPLVKNTIDWISRVKEVDGRAVSPFRGKVVGIGAASPGSMGGISMLNHMRDVFVRLGAMVVSDQLALSSAGKAFNDQDKITDDRSALFLSNSCRALAFAAARLRAEPD